MKKTTRVLALLLTLLLAASMLCGCESIEEKYAALAGTWIMYQPDSEEQVWFCWKASTCTKKRSLW